MKKILVLSFMLAATIFGVAAQSVVSREDAPMGALSGRNICLWQSHGRYYDAKDDRWKWQRCRLFGTVEDLYTRSYVVPFLVPMLENAGAYVMLPRERDEHRFEALLDHDLNGYEETHGKQKWSATKAHGFGMPHPLLQQGENPFVMGHARQVKTAVKQGDKESTASWSAKIPEAGEYAVYIGYPAVKEAVTDAKFTVHTATGPRRVTVDQTRGAGTWVYLGTFPFDSTGREETLVSLTNRSAQQGVVVADVVRIGGGMGSVSRNGQTSGMPRWAEAARYWLQYAGMPDSVYSHEADDYKDDIFGRPMWVNHLKQELNIPVDLVMAFHSDAGTEAGDLTVGTMGIYFTNKGRKFADGRPRALSGQLADSIVSSVVRDIRAAYEPDWTRRKMRDKSYVEARIPEVPTMLLELLSHQNFADMRYGLDPQFKFDVSRAVYKGILRYLAARNLARNIVSPLAPGAFAIASKGSGSYCLSWQPTADPLEPTARSDRYIIEERDGRFWRQIGETSATSFDVEIPRGALRSYRVIALNAGGRSFPSEILAAGRASGRTAPEVMVVNGFTRVSAPDNFSAGNMAGFGMTDPGVPLGTDYSFTGKQYDFDRTHEWTHDDSPGFGASHADRETYPRTGNTFDYVATHGAALMAAGCSFVSSSAEAFAADYYSRPAAVDLILGLQKETQTGRGAMPSKYKALTPELQQRLRALAAEGVPLMVSGSYVGSDLTSVADRDFARTVFGFEWRTSHATAIGGVSEVRSSLFSEFGGGRFLFGMNFGDEPYQVASVDAIYPSSALGSVIMRYDGSQAPAAVAFEPSVNRTVAFGFPFETISSETARADLMKQIIKFFKI